MSICVLRWGVAVTFTFYAIAAHAGEATVQQQTVQQQFDAASAAFDARHWPEALVAFDALESRLAARGGRSLALVKVRRGIVLHQLGRSDEAGEELRQGLPKLKLDDATLAVDRYVGYMSLGKIETNRFAPIAAVAAYHAAEHDGADAADKFEAIVGAARTETYLDPEQAIADVDRAIAMTPKDNKAALGQLRTLRGRALVNGHHYSEGRRDQLAAIDLFGGLTTKVGAVDIAVRSDLAISSLLLGDEAAAKKYLAYAAAGTLEDGFARGADMEPPTCDAAAGLNSDDVVVVEFGIGADGTVTYSIPVFVSRAGAAAAEFARAVGDWSWPPAKLAKIPALFRLMTRVELRCSIAHDRPSTQAVFDLAVRQWLASKNLLFPPETRVAAADLPGLRQAIDVPGPPLSSVPALIALSRNLAASEPERQAAAARWTAAVVAADPPAMVRAAAGVAAAGSDDTGSRRRYLGRLVALLSDPTIAGDPPARAAVRLYLADGYITARQTAAAKASLTEIVDDTRLEAGSPFRAAAFVRRSAIEAGDKDLPSARADFEQSGLSEAQCALIDAQPAIVRRAGGTSDYPEEAIGWGISGWAVTEFDITADGRTSAVRAVVAYPPFVFDKPTVRIAERMRYTQSFRPSGGLGCGSERFSQGFRVVRSVQ